MSLDSFDRFNSFDEFYEDAIKKPPFDLPTNPRGFPYGEPPKYSCQSALMPILQYVASQCDTVTEFGCREGYSTAAFLKGLSLNNKEGKQLLSVDMQNWKSHDFFCRVDLPAKWTLKYKDIVSGGWEIEETDYLHVDDLHTYDQVKEELRIHGHKAKRFLSFHDTYSQGAVSLDVKGAKGICPAIEEYTKANGWRSIYKVDFNHGLWIFERN